MDGKMWIEDGHLWYKPEEEGPPLIFPPICDRRAILNPVLAALAAPSRAWLYALLHLQYWWKGIYKDCLKQARLAVVSQVERAQFTKPPYLCPAEKGGAPLRIWLIDTIT